MDLLLISALVAFSGWLIAYRGNSVKRAALWAVAVVGTIYLLTLINELVDYNGHCYAFVGERWPCTRIEHFVFSAGETFFLGGIFLVIWLLIYAVFYTCTTVVLSKRAKT